MSWKWVAAGAVAVTGAVFCAVRVKRTLGDPLRRAERELDIRDRTLREEHPDTVALRHRAHYLSETGDFAGALEVSEQLLAERVRALGEDDPHVLVTRHNLAALRGRAGDAAGAAEEFERLALDMERVHGADDAHAAAARRAAVRWREEAEGGSRGTTE
ncbi:hypothetical protein ACFV6F_40290 [Kitasatospora phosalacinea]|uniref:hypothetical protein n=1 Tax=Kitasatospora phosalacinea TaxID=2065 RepID=UPI003655CF70